MPLNALPAMYLFSNYILRLLLLLATNLLVSGLNSSSKILISLHQETTIVPLDPYWDFIKMMVGLVKVSIFLKYSG